MYILIHTYKYLATLFVSMQVVIMLELYMFVCVHA